MNQTTPFIFVAFVFVMVIALWPMLVKIIPLWKEIGRTMCLLMIAFAGTLGGIYLIFYPLSTQLGMLCIGVGTLAWMALLIPAARVLLEAFYTKEEHDTRQ